MREIFYLLCMFCITLCRAEDEEGIKRKPYIHEIVSEEEYDEMVLKNKKPVIVDFYHEACQPCQRLAPILENMIIQENGKILLIKMDVTQSDAKLIQQLEVTTVPTLMSFYKGKLIDKILHSEPGDDLKKMINNLLEKQKN